MNLILIILLIFYIAGSIYVGYYMGRLWNSVFWGIVNFVASIMFTPIFMYFLTKDMNNDRWWL